MRILVADRFPSGAIERLRGNGHEVAYEADVTEDTLGAALADRQAVVVRSTRVTAAAIEVNPGLDLIVRAGAGTNTIDVAAAQAHSVAVCNTPGKNSVAVAELTMGLILAIDRNIADQVAELRLGQWNKKRWSRATGLKGRTIGIIGFGDIGAEVAKRADAFGMKVVTVDRSGRSEAALERMVQLDVDTVPNLESLVAVADILTLHVPSVPVTVGMISRYLLERVRPGTVIINTSRGEVVDEEALLAVIDEKDLRIGLDVYLNEPGAGDSTIDSALARHPRVYGTHHIGASTEQAQQAVADEVVDVVESFAAGHVRNQVLP
ncbi:MAG: NAD(P)-binding domain-containing protein [bacterium]|nr:NAD(P)-binding domain-containing protein [bacterium]